MKSSYRPALCSLLSMFAAIPSFGVQDGMPEPFSADRYDAMLKRSPFAVATPPTPAVAEPTDPFPGLYVAGISKMRFEDGTEKDRVTIKTRGDLNGGFTLIGSEPNKDGYAVTSVQSPDNWKETKVIIKKGTEFATLSFDLQSTPSAPTPTQNPPPRPVMPNQPRTPAPNGTGMNPNFTNGRNAPIQVKNAASRAIPSPNPNPGMMQPSSQPQGAVNPPIAPGLPDSSHRRIRQINVKP